jgi:hypothetical protein
MEILYKNDHRALPAEESVHISQPAQDNMPCLVINGTGFSRMQDLARMTIQMLIGNEDLHFERKKNMKAEHAQAQEYFSVKIPKLPEVETRALQGAFQCLGIGAQVVSREQEYLQATLINMGNANTIAKIQEVIETPLTPDEPDLSKSSWGIPRVEL